MARGKYNFLSLQANSYVTAYAADGTSGGQRTMAKASKTWSLNQWYHIAFVYNEAESSNADKFKIYIDGALQPNTVSGYAIGNLHPSTANFNIGRLTDVTTNEFNGKIDEVAIFNSAKSASDIATIYNGGTPGSLSSLSPLGWWQFEEGSGTTAIDSGTGGNNGTINGATYSTDVPT